jgi:hypothetical protein
VQIPTPKTSTLRHGVETNTPECFFTVRGQFGRSKVKKHVQKTFEKCSKSFRERSGVEKKPSGVQLTVRELFSSEQLRN